MAVKSIIIEIKGKDVKLTLEEARGLYNDLSELFNNYTTTVSIPSVFVEDGTSIGPTYKTNGVEFPYTGSTTEIKLATEIK